MSLNVSLAQLQQGFIGVFFSMVLVISFLEAFIGLRLAQVTVMSCNSLSPAIAAAQYFFVCLLISKRTTG